MNLITHPASATWLDPAVTGNPCHIGALPDVPARSMAFYLQELPPHSAGDLQRHRHESVHIVTAGAGYSEIGPETVRWAAGDFVYTPPWVWHRHYNDGDGAGPDGARGELTAARSARARRARERRRDRLPRSPEAGCRRHLRPRRFRLVINRLSHVELAVTDLDRSRAFYVDVLGLTAYAETDDALYLRAPDEFDVWSLKLTLDHEPGLLTFGFRVGSEDALDELASIHAASRWLAPGNEPGRGRTLRVRTPSGHVVDFQHAIDEVPFHDDRGRTPADAQPAHPDRRRSHAPGPHQHPRA